MTDPPSVNDHIVVGLEFDQLSATAEWRWYIEDRTNPQLVFTRNGEWRKKRNRAKKDLQAEMVEKKSTKKDPDRVRLDKSWVWGPDRYFPRFENELTSQAKD